MRNAMVQLILVIIGIYSIHAARLLATSSIHLRIRPAGAEKKVYAINGRDTLEMTGSNGLYTLRAIAPGKWLVLVTAAPSYQDARRDLTLGPGDNFDMGDVLLAPAAPGEAGASAGRSGGSGTEWSGVSGAGGGSASTDKKGTLAESPDFD